MSKPNILKAKDCPKCHAPVCMCYDSSDLGSWVEGLRGVFDLSGKYPEETLNAIAKFIHSLLSNQRTEYEKELKIQEQIHAQCEKQAKDAIDCQRTEPKKGESYRRGYQVGYNEARTEVLKEVDKLIENCFGSSSRPLGDVWKWVKRELEKLKELK